MKSYSQYYEVLKNETSATKISTNDFIRMCMKPYTFTWTNNHPIKVYYSLKNQPYPFYPLLSEYCNYADKVVAIKQAKDGFLNYIESLIRQANSNYLYIKAVQIWKL